MQSYYTAFYRRMRGTGNNCQWRTSLNRRVRSGNTAPHFCIVRLRKRLGLSSQLAQQGAIAVNKVVFEGAQQVQGNGRDQHITEDPVRGMIYLIPKGAVGNDFV